MCGGGDVSLHKKKRVASTICAILCGQTKTKTKKRRRGLAGQTLTVRSVNYTAITGGKTTTAKLYFRTQNVPLAREGLTEVGSRHRFNSRPTRGDQNLKQV